MHRSGTSACTRTISLLGADLPTNLMPPQPGNNEAGFWESMDVYQLNDEILASAGSCWDDWLPFNPDWSTGGAASAFRERALSILEHDFGTSSLFVLKDPRICRLLPFWLEVLKTFNAEPKCLIIIRNPLEVAASLRLRDGFSPVKSHAIWLRHMLDVEHYSRSFSRAFLRYDDLLTDWRRVVSRLSAELGLRWPRRSATVEVEIDKFLDGRHRHHALGEDRVKSHPDLAVWIKDAFQAFIDLDVGNNPGEAEHQLDRIREEFDLACQLLGSLARSEEMARSEYEASTTDRLHASEARAAESLSRVTDLEALVEKQEAENCTLTQTAKHRDERIAELIALAKERESHLLDLKENSNQLETRFGELEALANQRATLIAELKTLVSRREEENRTLTQTTNYQDERIAELTAFVKERETFIRELKEISSQLKGCFAKQQEEIHTLIQVTNHQDERISELTALVKDPRSLSDEIKFISSQTETRVGELEELALQRASRITELEILTVQRGVTIAKLEDLADQRATRIHEFEVLVDQSATRIHELEVLADNRATRIHELEVLADQRATRIGELEGLADQRATRIGELEGLADQRATRIGELEGLADQRATRIGELEGLAHHADQRHAELESQLMQLQEAAKARIEINQALLFKLNAIQLSASWQLARPLHGVESRWPGLVRGLAAVEKLAWWTATAQLSGQLSLRRQSQALLTQGLFDLGWYIQQNPDVVLQGMNPILHWLVAGWQQGRNPNPLFDINWYLQHNSDVRQANINPLIHYIQTGASQGRLPHPLFDTRWYLDHNPDAANSTLNPLAHYLRSHPSERRDPHPLFNTDWYLRQHGDVETSGENPLVHFLSWGAAAGRDPNPFFDSSWYLARYPNVGKQGLNPLVHYVCWGAVEGWNPSPLFDTHWYLEQHPEIAAALLNPLAHYLHTGIHQGWPSHPAPLPAPNKLSLSSPERDPAVNGFQQRPAANVEELDKVVTLLNKQEALFSDTSPPSRILVIDWKPPTPDRDSGSYRISRLLFCLRDAGFDVDFIGDRMAEGPQYVEQLISRRIKTLIGREAAIRHLAEQGNQYRLAFLARPETFERYLPIVRTFAPQAKVLYDTVDLHWVRFARTASSSTKPNELQALLDRSQRYKRVELANAQSADITLAISEEEKQTLLSENPALKVAVLPNLHEIASWRVPFDERRDLFFIGGFDHEPNVDAVTFFISHILPLVTRELPNIRFHIVGSNMPASIRGMATNHVVPVGYVDDVEPYFAQCRVFVAPLRHGAGMKGKVGQSLSFGLPVVTTPIGAEGIGMIDEMHALIRKDPGDFAQGIIRLYKDEPLWQRLSEGGRELIRQRFSIEAVRDRLLWLVEKA